MHRDGHVRTRRVSPRTETVRLRTGWPLAGLMDTRSRDALLFVASQLVFVAAMLHIGIGAVEWLRRVQYGLLVPYQLKFPLFILAGVAVIAGMGLAWQAERKRPWYLAGFVTMLGFVFTYFVFHLTTLEDYLIRGAQGHSHELTRQVLIDHYFAGPFETITLTIELLAAALLAVLYVFDDR